MKIYIALTSTGTLCSKIVNIYTQNKYAHCSISFDDKFNNMYSFGRKYLITPIIGSLIKEDLTKGLYKIKTKAKIMILEIDTTEEKYEKTKKEVIAMYQQKKLYKYNWLGIMNYTIHKSSKLKRRFTCSQFVSYILNKNNILNIKDPSLAEPCDYLNYNLKVIYEGTVKEYLKIKK